MGEATRQITVPAAKAITPFSPLPLKGEGRVRVVEHSRDLTRYLYRGLVCAKQSRAKVVPGKILHHAPPGRVAHLLDDFRMPIQLFDRSGDGIDISRLHNDSFNAVAHDVAGFAR